MVRRSADRFDARLHRELVHGGVDGYEAPGCDSFLDALRVYIWRTLWRGVVDAGEGVRIEMGEYVLNKIRSCACHSCGDVGHIKYICLYRDGKAHFLCNRCALNLRRDMDDIVGREIIFIGSQREHASS